MLVEHYQHISIKKIEREKMKPKKCDCLKYKSLDSKVKFLKYIPCYCIFCKKEKYEKFIIK